MDKPKILYVEDELALARIVCDTLRSSNFDVMHLTQGSKAIEAFKMYNPDICILDVMLPEVDGFDLAEQIRLINGSVPIIFLTAKDQHEDVVKGFYAGGNDYMRKPFSLEELILRIKSMLKLSSAIEFKNKQEEIRIGKLAYNSKLNILKIENQVKQLSYRENELMKLLTAKVNDQVLRKEILIELWGDDSLYNSRNLDVYITKLRDYIKAVPEIQLITLKGVGYKLIYTE